MPSACAATPGRERSRIRIAILKPSPSSPSRFAAETRTSSKVSSPVVEPLIPIFGSRRATAKPGVSASTTNAEMPAWPASGSVFAKTDPDAGHAGISAFVVEADTPGFAVARLEPKMGISGSTTGELTFDDVRVSAANLLGEEGDGFKIAMRILDRSRPGVAAQALGIAQGATDYALEYAKTRETMGKPIAQHQLIQAQPADMETECEAARGLLYRFGQMVDDGADDAELTKAAAMAKPQCGDVAMAVTTEAV